MPEPPGHHDERPARAPAGELLSAVSALLLLFSMFALKWYGVVELPTSADHPGAQTSAGAWKELTDLRWLMLLTALVTIASVVLHISQRSHGSQTDMSVLVAGLGSITAVLVFVRVLIDLPSTHSVVDVKLGGFLGLLATLGIAFGAFESIRELRRRRVRRTGRPPRRTDVVIDRTAR